MRLRGQLEPFFLTGAILSGAFLLSILSSGCGKGVEPVVQADTTRPPVLLPTGTIKEFVAFDTLIGFRHGSVLRWNVTETNSKTRVKLVVGTDSVIVPSYGSQQTGPLTAASKFTLFVNSGSSASVTIKVADSLTTGLWNEGRRWRIVDAMTWEVQPVFGTPVLDWYSHYTDQLGGLRTSFSLNCNSAEVQSNPFYPQPLPSGRFTARYDPTSQVYKATFNWKGRTYMIDTLTDDRLTVKFDSVLGSGAVATNRVRYKPEF